MTWLLPLLLLGCDRRPIAPPPLTPSGAVATASPIPSGAREVSRATVVAVGDIMMHGMVMRLAEQADEVGADGISTNNGGYDALFAGVAELVGSADVAFGNFETPVAPKSGIPMPRISENAPVFNAPLEALAALHDVGFDVLSLANNHSYDQSRVGLVETVEHLAASPIIDIGIGPTCDAAWAPRLVSAGDIKIGWIGTSDLYNYSMNAGPDEACVATFDEARALEEAAAARAAGAELVVVSVHWGVEYSTAPEPETEAVARRLIDGGVDLVLGHHPHVVQPVVVHEAPGGRVGVIALSLGNFLSNQAAWFMPGAHRPGMGNPRDGLALRLDVVRKDYGGKTPVIRTEIASVEAIPLWTENNTHSRGSEPVRIRVHLTARLLAEARAELVAAREAGDEARIVAAGRRVAWLESRRDQVESIIGPGLVSVR